MPMIDTLRKETQQILVAGNHTKIIQSILDFDYAAGREAPSVVGIISSGRKRQKFFWGDEETLISVYADVEAVKNRGLKPDFLLCITSAASTPRMTRMFFDNFPAAKGAHLFAEGVAERDALELVKEYGAEKLIAGPSGVGLCVPGALKLGAIGGILGERVALLGQEYGTTAVICSSGGMVNELMYQVVAKGSGISFAVSFGGDRFPVTSPLQWALEAQNDPQTENIVFFGELGGTDEYTLRDAIVSGQITKPVFAYIAGRFESKDEKIQFGHAKALAKSEDETSRAKMDALTAAGVQVSETFEDFMVSFTQLSPAVTRVTTARDWTQRLHGKQQTAFSAPMYTGSTADSYTAGILMRILDKNEVSQETIAFVDKVFAVLIDHGPHVSGAVNTMVTARAGRDMSSALASGVLTVGDRFGAAINGAANVWHSAVSCGTTASELVDEYSTRRQYILGIGHKKYSVYKPDPRVAELITHGSDVLRETPHLDLALAVAALTSKKRANLILNVDGAVSALLLDYLLEKEGFDSTALAELIEIEFFNALFLIPRSVGFIGNYLDQKRIDEGLFRLSDKDSYNF